MAFGDAVHSSAMEHRRTPRSASRSCTPSRRRRRHRPARLSRPRATARRCVPHSVARRICWTRRTPCLASCAITTRWPRNLFACRAPDGSPETVAIDWALVGIGPVGADLGQLVAGSATFFRAPVDDLETLDRRCFEAYVSGLEEAAGVVPRDVRLASLTTVLAQWTSIVAWHLVLALDPANDEWVEAFLASTTIGRRRTVHPAAFIPGAARERNGRSARSVRRGRPT